MNELVTIIKGNLTTDPDRHEVRGKTVTNFGVAHTPRRWDRDQGSFVNGDTIFLRLSAWGKQGENIYTSMRRGDRIIAEVELTQRTFTNRQDQEVTVMEGTVIEAGASMLFHEVDIDTGTTGGGGTHTAPGAPAPAHAATAPHEPPF